MELIKKIEEIGIIPVIKIKDIQNAVPLAKALIDGGIPIAEVTFRSEGAEKVIKEILKEYPDLLVGAGTVLTIEQAKAAVEAGAKFIVSPGFNPKTVAYCQEENIPIMPGCVTPTEIEMALEFEIHTLKFFPAAQFGGLAAINALCQPYTGIRFIPTGGITLNNLTEYSKSKNVIACGGSFMVKEDLIESKDWKQIESLCRQAVEIIQTAREDQ